MSFGDDPPFLLPPYATQRMKGKKPTKKTPNAAGTSDVTPDHDGPTLDLLWTDKYSPKTEKEVAVMPAKKRVIKDCLQNSALTGPQGQYKCLVLTGPAGSGKSTLIRVLGRSMGYNVIEYSNPASSRWEPVLSTEGYENQINQFERFLQDAMKFQPLGTSSRSRIILLDEVPDLTSDHIKSRFHELLINCISSKSPFLLVIVVSDAWTDPGARRRTDTVSLNMRDIVPAALVNDERCRTIEFNPIAPGQLRKVLEEINDCEIMSTNRGVSKETIDLIVDLSQGDIRNAINTLQFYSIPISSTPTIPKKRKLDSDDATTSTTCDITARGAPLDLFHAVGKVLHRKRDEKGLLDSKPEHILDSLPVAANLFIGYLHANYIDFTDNISQCAEASKWIAEADVLGVSGDWKEDAPAEYQALVAMHGIMRIPRTDVKRMYQFKKPAYIELPGESESRAPIKSVFGDIIEPTNDRWGDPADWGDPIRNDFSDEEYDNIFGDGEDLAALDVCP